MSHVLVKWADNWADEMDLDGFRVYEVSKWNKIKEKLKSHEDSFDFSVGTNEEVEYENGEALLEAITETAVTPEEVAILKKLFNGQYGEQSVFNNVKYVIGAK